MTTADPPRLCNYLEHGQLGAPCYEPKTEEGPWCAKHNNMAYRVCQGCGETATGLCPDCREQIGLSTPVCGPCKHLGPSRHGRVTTEQTPLADGEPEGGGIPSTIENIWAEFVEQAVLSLRASRAANDGAGEDEWATARRMVQTMATTSMLGLMSNLAHARGEGGNHGPG